MIRKLFSLNRPLVPSFLKKMDVRLMANYPLLWSLRVHLVLWYTLILALFTAGYFFLKPDDPRQDSEVYFPISVMVILALISTVVWLIFLLRFNVFKRFGHYKSWHACVSFTAYFISALAIFSLPFLPALIEDYRATQAFKPQEIVEEVNAMNVQLAHLTYDSLITEWYRDTVLVNDTLAEKGRSLDSESYTELEYSMDSAGYRKVVNRIYCGKRIIQGDSFQVLARNSFVFFEVPDYQFIEVDGRLEAISGVEFLRPEPLYFKIHKEHPNINLEEASNQYFEWMRKYSNPEYGLQYVNGVIESSSRYREAFDANTPFYLAQYRIQAVESGIENIVDRQFFISVYNKDVMLRFWLYPSFFLAILVWMFRHSTTKIFFLSLLVGFIVSVLVGVFTALFNLSLSESLVFQLMIWGGFLSLSFLSSNGMRNAIRGIGLNLTFLTVFFIPLLVHVIYWDSQPEWPYSYSIYSQAQAESMARAEWIGAVLVPIFLYFIAFPLYRNWYSSPEA